MSPNISSYPTPTHIKSALLRNHGEAIPPTDELEQLRTELQNYRTKSLERVKKASEDLRSIEESMRRMREREKGKGKAMDKIKRERDYTPIPPGDDSRYSRLSSHGPTHRPPLDPRKHLNSDDAKTKKKKKRKREEESDADTVDSRHRESPVTHTHPPPHKSQKTSHPHPKPLAGPDFSLPSSAPILPPRPVPAPPPVPGPSKPTEVTDDFSKCKAPQQVLVNTFYTSIEPWIRPIKEEDIGFLEYTADELEPFVMPKLGPLPGFTAMRPGGETGAPNTSAPQPKWDPSTLSDPDLLTEEKGHGPLTERAISALLPIPDVNGWKGVKAAEDAMEGRPGGNGAAAAARKERMNVHDLEVRVRETMKFYGLLGGTPDYTDKVDDPIATALRKAQQELRIVMTTNKKRRERLTTIARDRLGYQEYLDLRDSIDKNISNTYTKLQRKDVPKLHRKKKDKDKDKKADMAMTNGDTKSPVPEVCPAALGLGPDEENRLVVSEQLRQLVETRRQWVDAVGSVFETKERECPGRIWGVPKTSVFDGIDDEVNQLVSGSTNPPITKGKDKSKRTEDVDIG